MVKEIGVADTIVAIVVTTAVLYLTSIVIAQPYTLMAMVIVMLFMITVFFIIEYDRDHPVINI